MTIIANSAPLISLSKVGLLEIIKTLYGEILIPEAVYKEIVVEGKGKPGALEVEKSKWIVKTNVKNKKMVNLLLDEFGKGESEILVLAEEIEVDSVLIDEKVAARKLDVMKIPRLGTLGILLLAKEEGLIEEVKPIIEELKQKGFRMSRKVYETALKLAGEIEH